MFYFFSLTKKETLKFYSFCKFFLWFLFWIQTSIYVTIHSPPQHAALERILVLRRGALMLPRQDTCQHGVASELRLHVEKNHQGRAVV